MGGQNQKIRWARIGSSVVLIALAAAARLLPHPPNFAPVGAMALFGGATLGWGWGAAAALGAMFISDLFLGFHDTILYVYGSFVMISLIGRFVGRQLGAGRVVGGSLFGSIVFFIVTNFGVWAVGSLYPKTLAGLGSSYVAGIPFFRNTVLGDLFYASILFLAWAMANALARKLAYNQTAANYKGAAWPHQR